MTTAAAVPETRHEELEGDEALETLRRCGRRRLVLDAIARFRAADGFSHSRALAFQVTLTILPGLIALVGAAAAADIETLTTVVEGVIGQLAPGAVGDLLTAALEQGEGAARKESGEVALVGGLSAAALAGTTAMAQVERGANRLYGTEQDRPFLRKYLTAALLAATAGTLVVASVAVLVAGSVLSDQVDAESTVDAVWDVLRWPVGIAMAVGAIGLLFQHAPRRAQPEWSWLAFGAGAAAVLWLAFMVVFALYTEGTDALGATYGPLAGTIGVLLWTFGSSVALFLGLALTAQLEAVRAGAPAPQREDAA